MRRRAVLRSASAALLAGLAGCSGGGGGDGDGSTPGNGPGDGAGDGGDTTAAGRTTGDPTATTTGGRTTGGTTTRDPTTATTGDPTTGTPADPESGCAVPTADDLTAVLPPDGDRFRRSRVTNLGNDQESVRRNVAGFYSADGTGYVAGAIEYTSGEAAAEAASLLAEEQSGNTFVYVIVQSYLFYALAQADPSSIEDLLVRFGTLDRACVDARAETIELDGRLVGR